MRYCRNDSQHDPHTTLSPPVHKCIGPAKPQCNIVPIYYAVPTERTHSQTIHVSSIPLTLDPYIRKDTEHVEGGMAYAETAATVDRLQKGGMPKNALCTIDYMDSL